MNKIINSLKSIWEKILALFGALILVFGVIDYSIKWKITSFIYSGLLVFASFVWSHVFEVFILIWLAIITCFLFKNRNKIPSTKKLEENLTEKINEKLFEKEKNLKLLITNTISQTENQLRHRISLIRADVSRRFALDCEKDNLPEIAFGWWILAATDYAERGSDNMCNISIKGAKRAIEEIKTKSEIDFLLEKTSSISANLNRLKKEHLIEADLLENMFKEKLKSTPTE